MNIDIHPPQRPRPTVRIDLTAEEFVALYGLLYTGMNGSGEIRKTIESGMYRAAKSDPFLRAATDALENDQERDNGLVGRIERALDRASLGSES